MSGVMIPAGSITATLQADLSYNPNVHVQTVEIDRTGVSMYAMATNNFVKWYITLQDFQNLCWNIREMPHYSDASHSDVSNTDLCANTIFAFARPHGAVYGSDPYGVGSGSTTFNDGADASYAHVGTEPGMGSGGLPLYEEASGGTVKFQATNMQFYVPLWTDSPTYGNVAGSGTESKIGDNVVSYDRVMLGEDAATSITGSASERTSASATTTTWSFVDSSFSMSVNWAASQANTTTVTSTDFSYVNGPVGVDYDGWNYWGSNTIFVYADAGSNIRVTKPYNDAAADFIQIGMDPSGTATDFSSGVGVAKSGNDGGLGLGNTAYGVAAGEVGTGLLGNTEFAGSTMLEGLLDPLGSFSNTHTSGSMTNSSADDVNDSIDFGAYLSDYTTTHVDNTRNLIKVQIGKPTVQITQTAFTKALQQAIDKDMSNVLAVQDTVSLRYAIRDAFYANHLRGLQCGVPNNAGGSDLHTHAGAIPLELPLTVAGQVRYSNGAGSSTGQDVAARDDTTSQGTDHKKVYLTPVIELVANTYQHKPEWYTYQTDS